MEIALVTENVHAAHESALAHGGTEISPPAHKPWGQVISYIRSPDGTLVELCTPIGTSAGQLGFLRRRSEKFE